MPVNELQTRMDLPDVARVSLRGVELIVRAAPFRMVADCARDGLNDLEKMEALARIVGRCVRLARTGEAPDMDALTAEDLGRLAGIAVAGGPDEDDAEARDLVGPDFSNEPPRGCASAASG